MVIIFLFINKHYGNIIEQIGTTNPILYPGSYRMSWSNSNLFYKKYFLLLMTKRHIDILYSIIHCFIDLNEYFIRYCCICVIPFGTEVNCRRKGSILNVLCRLCCEELIWLLLYRFGINDTTLNYYVWILSRKITHRRC